MMMGPPLRPPPPPGGGYAGPAPPPPPSAGGPLPAAYPHPEESYRERPPAAAYPGTMTEFDRHHGRN